MTRLLVLQPSDHAPVGRLGEWLEAAGATLTVLGAAEVPEDVGDYQGLVCMGGPMSAYDDHHWVSAARLLLAKTIAARTPVLGVCLGAQLLASATGGRVRLGEAGPEVGPALVGKRDAAWQDPLFAELPFMPDVLQFHRDVIDVLPPRAELLAAAPKYANQAFRVGAAGYGLQFHIETTPEIVLDWARSDPDLAAAARPGELTQARLAEVHEHIEETWRPFAARFVALARGDLPVAGAGRHDLPLA